MKSRLIVITGSIATGKSLVTNILREEGLWVIDADKIAHDLMDKDQENYRNIVAEFGYGILDQDQNIDRKKLGQMVFTNKENLKKLNDLTHPSIFNKIKSEIKASEDSIVFLDMPLYIETLNGKYNDLKPDQVWLVYADKETQLSRLMNRNDLSEEEALARINSQMDIEDKKTYADFIIDNRGKIEETYSQIYEKLETLWE